MRNFETFFYNLSVAVQMENESLRNVVTLHCKSKESSLQLTVIIRRVYELAGGHPEADRGQRTFDIRTTKNKISNL